MVMLRVDIKLRLDFNQLPLKMQKRSFHVLLTKKTCLNSTMNSTNSANSTLLLIVAFYFLANLCMSDPPLFQVIS